MTSEQVERITDPATIRNIDWSDHYETTTPRGATPMFETAQDLSEREADANALEAYRAMVARLEGALADNEAAYVKCNARAARAESRLATARAEVLEYDAALALNMGRLEQAEARVDQLTDLLTLRTEALNRTGESNDRLRAALNDLAQHGTRYDLTPTHLVGDESFWHGYITRMDSSVRERARDALGES